MGTMSLEDTRARMGDRIRELRKAAGLSQRKLALVIGADNTYISRLERGAIENPTLKTLHRVAGALGVEVADLLA
ncbi:helix-turn-helix transcriptional regulator [Paraeggerthella sp.]|jgi:transcriptional regulator with XRE-family HTH domain|uniref:helix-turn-helix domain-containing protein n=1 Tax=Paraeggerthella sp. TaxID=2897350 RepID=UPI001C68DB8F